MMQWRRNAHRVGITMNRRPISGRRGRPQFILRRPMDRFLLAERSTYLGNTGAERFDKLLKLLPIVTLVVTLVTFVAFVVAYKNRQERPAYVVQTHDTQVEGKALQVEGVLVVEFLGIPFAESTAGANRFLRPIPRTLPRKLSARRWGPPCVQRKDFNSTASFYAPMPAWRDPTASADSQEPSAPDSATRYPSSAPAAGSDGRDKGASAEAPVRESPSEDCLHLNIWVPHTVSTNANSTSDLDEPNNHAFKRPVIVFFHGGGFKGGSNSDPRYDGRYLAALGGVIVVVPNYRVGSLAFVAGPLEGEDEEPGNLALLDQRLALEWVRSNIDDFGGDPACIAVAGAGAGASSLALHLLSPEAEGTTMDLHRFVLHSGSPVGPFSDQRASRQSQLNLAPLARRVGCAGATAAELIRCLRTVSSDLLARLEPGVGFAFEPTFESQYLPDMPSGLLLKSPPFRKQVLIGNVADEGLQTLEDFKKTLPGGLSAGEAVHRFLPRELAKYGVRDAKLVMRIYLTDSAGLSREQVWNSVSHLLGDLLYVCPTAYMAQYLSRGPENQVYMFRMSQRLSYSKAEAMTRYEDVDLVFGWPLRHSAATEAEKNLSREVIRAWSNFARFGNLPLVSDNSSGSTIEWPKYTDGEGAVVDISAAGFSLVPDEHRSHCAQLLTLAAAEVV